MVTVTLEIVAKLFEEKCTDAAFVKEQLLPMYVKEILSDEEKVQSVVIPAIDEAIQTKVSAGDYGQEFLKLASAIVELKEGISATVMTPVVEGDGVIVDSQPIVG